MLPTGHRSTIALLTRGGYGPTAVRQCPAGKDNVSSTVATAARAETAAAARDRPITMCAAAPEVGLLAMLEVGGPLSRDFVVLEGTRLSVGKSSEADVVITSDPATSRLHFVLERVGQSWFVRDLGSRNGTFVNNERVIGERPLRDGDELLAGRTRPIYQDKVGAKEAATDTLKEAPRLTARERDVLVELCRPLLLGNAFTQPTSVHDKADALYVSTAAIKQHLGHLYDKLDVAEQAGEARRVQSANEALSRGAVAIADITRRSKP